MSGPFAHALAALLVEDSDFRSSGLGGNDADDTRARHVWRSGGERSSVVSYEQDSIEGDLVTRLAVEMIDGHDTAGIDSNLPAAGLNNGVH